MVIGIPLQFYDRISPFLQEFEITRQPRVSNAVNLLAHQSFDLFILPYPLPDMELEEFIEIVEERTGEDESNRSAILLVAFPGKVEEAGQYIGKGVNGVMSMYDKQENFRDVIGSLFRVAPRVDSRIAAWVQVREGSEKNPMLCKTINISLAGMLILGNRVYPVGTPVNYKVMLPWDRTPIVGQGTVVRHTEEEGEETKGMGIRFDTFEGESGERLEKYLDQKSG